MFGFNVVELETSMEIPWKSDKRDFNLKMDWGVIHAQGIIGAIVLDCLHRNKERYVVREVA